MAIERGSSRPAFQRPASWAVAKRIRERNGRWSLRPCPNDFEQQFICLGRPACVEHYGTWRKTVDRWLEECGKERLIELRAAHVRQQRIEARIGKRKAAQVRALEVQTLAALAIPDPLVAALAADYLRRVCNGGWHVSRTQHGDWWVGTVCRSPASLVAMAERHGFDAAAATLQVEADIRVSSAR